MFFPDSRKACKFKYFSLYLQCAQMKIRSWFSEFFLKPDNSFYPETVLCLLRFLICKK